MSVLAPEVLTALEKTMPICIATADGSGNPNLIYVTYLKAVDDKTLVVADNKFDKTRKNLDRNPRMSVVVLDPDTRKAYQIKCRAECVEEGSRFSDVVDWVHVKHPQLEPRAAFYLHAEEVYCGAERLA